MSVSNRLARVGVCLALALFAQDEIIARRIEDRSREVTGDVEILTHLVLRARPAVTNIAAAVGEGGHEAADFCGYYSVKSDPDGVVRWLPLVIQCAETTRIACGRGRLRPSSDRCGGYCPATTRPSRGEAVDPGQQRPQDRATPDPTAFAR